jgi:hypothetical protein
MSGAAFGCSTALSANGNRLVVGARGERSAGVGVNGDQTPGSASAAGAVYAFTRSGSSWSQEAYIKASNTGGGDYFGTSVALSADGKSLAVGANQESSAATGVGGDQSNNSATWTGAVYMFAHSGSAWSQEAYIKASNTDAYDHFGASVALAADGMTLAVGAESEASAATGIDGDQADDSTTGAGAVYVFARSGVAWSQQAYIKGQKAGARLSFGTRTALSSKGNVLVVAASSESVAGTDIKGAQTNSAVSAGAVYIFGREGSSWSQRVYIKASNPGAYDNFGGGLALSTDGATLAVGARGEGSASTGFDGDQADNSAMFAGAVYVFR